MDTRSQRPQLEFFFDCSSPWTYLAFEGIEPIARQFDVPIQWRPILVGGVFNAVNPSVYEARAHPVPAKAAYASKDLQDWARWAGLTIVSPAVFPVNSVLAMRACLALAPRGLTAAFAREVFQAYWGRGEDISQDPVLSAVCARLNLDWDDLRRAASVDAIRHALRANGEELIARGGFGSPTLFVGGDDMYFGNDRLPLVAEALRRRLATR